MAGEWNAYLRGQQDAVKQKFAEYEGEIEEAQNLYRAAMDTSEPPFPEEVLGNEISLGKICRQLPECESIRVLAAEGVKSIQGKYAGTAASKKTGSAGALFCFFMRTCGRRNI